MGAIVKGSGPVDTSARLAALRKEMEKEQVHAYVVLSEDAHASEYSAPCDLRRAFISGFTGSAGEEGETCCPALLRLLVRLWFLNLVAPSPTLRISGTAIVQLDSAILSTDGRYHLQAGQQLDSNWTLHKHGEKGA